MITTIISMILFILCVLLFFTTGVWWYFLLALGFQTTMIFATSIHEMRKPLTQRGTIR